MADTEGAVDEHPYKKFERIKQIIAENKPSRFNFFRRSERKHYEKMKNQAHLVCLLEAFGKGYVDEIRLSKQLIELTKKDNVDNAEQIRQFAVDLQHAYQGNQQDLGMQQAMQFKAKGVYTDMIKSAKLLQLFYPATHGIPTDNPNKVAVATKIVNFSMKESDLVSDQNKIEECDKDLSELSELHY